MSEPIRYLASNCCECGGNLEESESGDLVDYSDYLKIAKENELLKNQYKGENQDVRYYQSKVNSLTQENESLKKEISALNENLFEARKSLISEGMERDSVKKQISDLCEDNSKLVNFLEAERGTLKKQVEHYKNVKWDGILFLERKIDSLESELKEMREALEWYSLSDYRILIADGGYVVRNWTTNGIESLGRGATCFEAIRSAMYKIPSNTKE